ncbi:AAA family ATPase [Streptomyces polygonati]|uniref:AAA family ATPase n=1 Tax=Streptomyces polygonati TaxID=1617087 RepID=A0ABV8HUE2_9ACTN
MNDWRIYRGEAAPHDDIGLLPPPPPWRDFALSAPDRAEDGHHVTELTPEERDAGADSGRRLPRAAAYHVDARTVEAVNTALYLRRPLLVTGDPGVGKSSLAHAVARELRLGRVLRWPVNSRTTLRDGLYRYDSLGRLEEAGVNREGGGTGTTGDLGRFVRLGPLGTALAPYALPRVLVVDEIDKADIDLPNDLLDVFEEGTFEIPELSRAADAHPVVEVRPADDGRRVTVRHGVVHCHTFPFVILTSNGERDFPPAFLRRCVRLHLSPGADRDRLRAIVRAHLPTADEDADRIIERFVQHAATGELAVDQLLNAVYFMGHAVGQDVPDMERVADLIFQHLNTTVPTE